jgi:hypothetical protein
MTRSRREFSQSDRIAIRGRASDGSGRVFCEGCGVWLKQRADYEIDHVIPEGMRPLADLQRKLTPADGRLLCVAVCHPRKTKDDKGDINEGKRREAAELGLRTPPRRKIGWGREKADRPPLQVAPGKPSIARRYGL